MPHLLFHGPAGTGKTSSAHALARELYGDDQWRHFTLDTNASDERGIDSIRGRIKNFAQTGSLGERFNLIVLDECDNLTPDAQAALRRTMEDYSHNCRFVLLCNNLRRVIPPIQSRCARFQFAAIPAEAVRDAVQRVCEREGIEWEGDALDELAERANGSLRDALNLVEAAPRPITADAVRRTTFSSGIWEDIIAKATTKGGQRDAEKILVKQIVSGASPDQVFDGFFQALQDRLTGNEKGLDQVIPVLGEYEFRVAMGGSYELQARCFLRHLARIGKVNE